MTISRWDVVKVGGGAVAAVLIIGGVLHWGASAPNLQKPVGEQWQDAVRQLGIEPVYPPQEDILVGDIFAMITKDAMSDVAQHPLAGRSLKLAHLDMTKEIEENYRNAYEFPRAAAESAKAGTANTADIFKIGLVRNDLPLVVFPGFTIARLKQSSGAGGSSSGITGSLGGGANSSEVVEFKIAEAETYGVPALAAENRLIAFCNERDRGKVCSDHGARQQLSILVGPAAFQKVRDLETGEESPRLSVDIALVSRVFLTRNIEARIQGSRSISGGGRLGLQQNGAAPEQAGEAAKAAPEASTDALAKLRAELEVEKKENRCVDREASRRDRCFGIDTRRKLAKGFIRRKITSTGGFWVQDNPLETEIGRDARCAMA